MAEYIEREKALDAVFGQFCASSDETEAALNAAIEEIRAIPAADVRPVRVGKLEKYGAAIRCSVCGFDTQSWDVNFCPNCGADMREES